MQAGVDCGMETERESTEMTWASRRYGKESVLPLWEV